MGSAGTAVEEDTETDILAGVADPWVTIVWNDPVNLMSYVTYVFESYFGATAGFLTWILRRFFGSSPALASASARSMTCSGACTTT